MGINGGGLEENLKAYKWGITISGREIGKIAYLQLCLVIICSICFFHTGASDVETGS